MCVAQISDVLGTGVVAGAFLMGTFAVHPAASRLDGSAHVLFRQELIRRLTQRMPPLMLLPVIALIWALMLCRTALRWGFDSLGLALSLATIGITVAVNVPLNRHFAGWSADALPQEWEKSIARWNIAHLARTATAVAAFLCAILAGS